MMISTFEGFVENGQIQLKDNVSLPDEAKVYVVIPEFVPTPIAQVKTPKLANPTRVGDFTRMVYEMEKKNALTRLDEMRSADAHLQKSDSIDLIREDRNR